MSTSLGPQFGIGNIVTVEGREGTFRITGVYLSEARGIAYTFVPAGGAAGGNQVPFFVEEKYFSLFVESETPSSTPSVDPYEAFAEKAWGGPTPSFANFRLSGDPLEFPSSISWLPERARIINASNMFAYVFGHIHRSVDLQWGTAQVVSLQGEKRPYGVGARFKYPHGNLYISVDEAEISVFVSTGPAEWTRYSTSSTGDWSSALEFLRTAVKSVS